MSDTVDVAALLNARLKPMTLTDRDLHVGNLLDAIEAAIDGGNTTALTADGTVVAAIVPWPARQPETAEQPDLYQVSQVQVINVSKLARILMRLVSNDVLSAADLGLPADIGWTDIESWLRS